MAFAFNYGTNVFIFLVFNFKGILIVWQLIFWAYYLHLKKVIFFPKIVTKTAKNSVKHYQVLQHIDIY